MIEINVHLKSAISHTRDRELARFVICNTGEAAPPGEGHYYAESYRGRTKRQLDKRQPSHSGQVRHHRREAEHVLNLVSKALQAMGYGLPQAGQRSAAQRGRGGTPIAGPPV